MPDNNITINFDSDLFWETYTAGAVNWQRNWIENYIKGEWIIKKKRNPTYRELLNKLKEMDNGNR